MAATGALTDSQDPPKAQGDAPTAAETARASLAQQRRALPDQPGVYLFRDARGRVIYVGKAKSVRKRVASHFSKAQVGGRGSGSSGHAEMVASVEQIECVVVATEAEALLAEQSFIKQYRPRFNIRLRDDKSYPFIAISLDEPYPRVYFTRERHRQGRAYFGPYSNAKRVRATLEVLAKVFMFRSCTGPEPGRRSGSPCLDYYIKRCGAPCVDYVSKEEYRDSIDGVIDFLNGRFSAIERDLEARMLAAASEEEFEQATLERNRLQAVRSLLERRRVTSESVGTFDAVAVAVDGRDANAQVFQVRDGVLSDRQSFYLANEAERDEAEVGEEFMLQYYGGYTSIPALLVVRRGLDRHPALADALSSRRGGPVRSAGSWSWPSATRYSRSTRSACAPSAGARAGSRRSTACRRRSAWMCLRSGSSASTSRTSAARTRSPRWSCSRAALRRSPTTVASRSARPRAHLMTSPRWPRS
jgi:excinuclease ABC subunit C